MRRRRTPAATLLLPYFEVVPVAGERRADDDLHVPTKCPSSDRTSRSGPGWAYAVLNFHLLTPYGTIDQSTVFAGVCAPALSQPTLGPPERQFGVWAAASPPPRGRTCHARRRSSRSATDLAMVCRRQPRFRMQVSHQEATAPALISAEPSATSPSTSSAPARRRSV